MGAPARAAGFQGSGSKQPDVYGHPTRLPGTMGGESRAGAERRRAPGGGTAGSGCGRRGGRVGAGGKAAVSEDPGGSG